MGCETVRKFWQDLTIWCETNIDVSLANLSRAELILGITGDRNDRKTKKIQNWLILTAKFYIHREKLFNQGQFSLIAFLREVKRKLLVERVACQIEGKLNKFRCFRRLYAALGGQESDQ